MDNVNETCQSIIDTIKRIDDQQEQFYNNMMKLLETLEKTLRSN